MRRSIRVTTRAALLALSAFCAASATAQDPAKVAPDVHKVRPESASVRVLEVTGKAGQKAAMHRHPDYVTYNFSGGKTTFSYPKGKPVENVAKAGDVVWHKSGTHGSVIGDAGAHALLVEIK